MACPTPESFHANEMSVKRLAELESAEIFSDGSNPVLDIFVADFQSAAARVDAAQGYVNMRVFPVVVRCGHPLERSAEILPHPRAPSASPIRETTSRVSCCSSARSPNSREMISFHRRSSFAFCQRSRRSAM